MDVNKYDGRASKQRLPRLLGNNESDFNPDEISWITGCIGITDWEGAERAKGHGHYVINVADELVGGMYDDLDIPFVGGRDQLQAQMDTFADVVNSRLENAPEQKIVVHCAMGMERAPLAVLGYLMKYKNMNIDTGYELLKSKRPIVFDRRHWINNGMWSY